MPDANGRPYLREIRKKAEQLGIVTHTKARQRKAELEAEVAAHPLTQYYTLKEALCEEFNDAETRRVGDAETFIYRHIEH